MLATELLFVYIYCLVDDAIKAAALLSHAVPVPLRPAQMLNCSRSRWSGACSPAQRERVPGRDPPRLATPVPLPAGPAGGQPPHPLAMGRR